ncbi:uncharacterized protein B0P05DRAFT_547973 [Gilbertella persicaria]|uniref:uncharacterized protein n=1 Tax=Gilbertella persicaria TaxID=101096 RepID=UPI002220B091|nr:uncharacterized protein B0P05DRAFT_547973 [Gilbertella persicaria]KAI8074288.1 hypothetical protein B0P05DRAFT_547973 [Gilbertella persicaria]
MSAPPYKQYSNSDYYSNKTALPPPLPHHIETKPSSDQFGLNEAPVNSPVPYAAYTPPNNPPGFAPAPYQNLNDAHRDSMSDMKFMNHYDSDDEIEKIIPRERKRRSCMDKLCCGCCTCCPKWLRWCSCIILIIIVILAIVIGVLAATFKVPTISYSGLQGEPTVAFANNVLNMDFKIGINVDNPNWESITFEKILADAYYPSPYNVYIGGGNVTDLHINSNGATNITFPFNVKVNSSDSGQQGVLMDLMTKCGLDGSTPQNIDIDYYVHPTVRIIGIPITITISKSMSMACPIKSSDLTSILGSGISKI